MTPEEAVDYERNKDVGESLEEFLVILGSDEHPISYVLAEIVEVPDEQSDKA